MAQKQKKHRSHADFRHRSQIPLPTVEDIEQLSQNWESWAGEDNGEELVDALRRCLAVLGDRAKVALELRFREHASRETIAATLGMSEHGAKNLMQRAKKTLRDCIESKLK